MTWGSHLPESYLFAFSYCSCSYSSHGKNIGVVCHSLLQQTTFCQFQLSYSWVTNFKLKSSQINSFPLRRLWRSPISQMAMAPWPSNLSPVLSFICTFLNLVIYLFRLCFNHGYVFCNPPSSEVLLSILTCYPCKAWFTLNQSEPGFNYFVTIFLRVGKPLMFKFSENFSAKSNIVLEILYEGKNWTDI